MHFLTLFNNCLINEHFSLYATVIVLIFFYYRFIIIFINIIEQALNSYV